MLEREDKESHSDWCGRIQAKEDHAARAVFCCCLYRKEATIKKPFMLSCSQKIQTKIKHKYSQFNEMVLDFVQEDSENG